jgi:uncharacterized membrane protein
MTHEVVRYWVIRYHQDKERLQTSPLSFASEVRAAIARLERLGATHVEISQITIQQVERVIHIDELPEGGIR